MRRNYDDDRASTLEEEKMNPVQTVVGLAALLLVVVVFCFAVWKITHADRGGAVTGGNTENVPDSIVNWGSQTASPEATEGTDEDEQEPEEPSVPENALGMTFDPVEEYVTAKDVTNLRSEPSTEQGDTTVVTQLRNGQNALRTGINTATGWSRLEYNGQVVYAVSQYLTEAEAAQ